MSVPVDAPNALRAALKLGQKRRKDHFAALAKTMSDADDARISRPDEHAIDEMELNALLAQYDSLRNEAMFSTNNRVQILMLGLAAVAAITGGTFALTDPSKSDLPVRFVFSFAIPLACLLVLFVWISEAMRARRAGLFIAAEVEARINQILGRFSMKWEAALWTGALPRDELFGPSMMAVGIFGAIAFLAPPFGCVMANKGQFVSWSYFVTPPGALYVGGPYAVMLLAAAYCLGQMRRLRNTGYVAPLFYEGAD